MKNKKLIRNFISLVMAFLLLFLANDYSGITMVVQAKEEVPAFDENFIPFRSFIPRYLSINSSVKSKTIKYLWKKLLHEEALDPAWSTKYYVDNSTDYIGLGGIEKSFSGITFATDSRDFDAFFGNSIVANPELFQELMASEEFAPIIYSKLIDPITYPFFAKSMAELTFQGLYLGDSSTSSDNILKNYTYNNLSFDILMLNCLASLYEGDGTETYLSSIQVNWLMSYERFLYDDYADNKEASLAFKYPAIYDLIARSADASNDYRQLGQEFFDYVISSERGAGPWLSQNININIEGLQKKDNIISLFNSAEGWCGGNDASNNCSNKQECIEKASENDKFALALSKSTHAMTYIKNNSATNSAYGLSQYDAKGWQYRYRIKHTKWPVDSNGNIIATNIVPMNRVVNSSGGGRAVAKSWGSIYRGMGDGMVVANTSTYQTLYLKNILPSDANPNGVANPHEIIIPIYYEGAVNTHVSVGPKNAGDSLSHNTTTYSDYSITYSDGIIYKGTTSIDYYGLGGENPNTPHTTVLYYQFDTSNLKDLNSLNNAYIQIRATAGCGTDSVNGPGANTYEGSTSYAYCNVGGMPTIFVKSPVDDCDLNGHDYTGEAIFNQDNTDATIIYTCSKDSTLEKEHTLTYHVSESDITTKTQNGVTTYTVVGKSGESYTKNVGLDDETNLFTEVPLSPNNATNYYQSNYSDKVIYHGGGILQSNLTRSQTSADAKINGAITAGSIPLGAKRLVFHFTASEKLEELNIKVLSETGKIIGQCFTTDNTGKCEIKILNTSDAALKNCYVVFSGHASTFHTKNDLWWNPGAAPSTATIGITSMEIYY